MLNFEEELSKFQPSKDIDALNDCITERNMKDAADVLLEILQEKEQVRIQE